MIADPLLAWWWFLSLGVDLDLRECLCFPCPNAPCNTMHYHCALSILAHCSVCMSLRHVLDLVTQLFAGKLSLGLGALDLLVWFLLTILALHIVCLLHMMFHDHVASPMLPIESTQMA